MKNIKLTASQIIAVGFALVILLGAILLWLPISTVGGKTTPFLDALFTSTTSVCVTGLVTFTTATHWTIFGKIVILILIQIGGLGVVSCMMFTLITIRKKITIKNRRLIQEAYNLEHMSGVVRLVKNISIGTFTVEGAGAILLALQFVPEYGLSRGMWRAVFTAISAFCNAGIDVLGDYSLAPYVGDPLVNFTVMALIVLGGIGFSVWWDVIAVWKQKFQKQLPVRTLWTKLELHSKLAIFVTVLLIVSGTLLFFALEYNNETSIGTMSLPKKLMACLFQSVTTRTAGFLTVPQEYFTDASAFLTMILMFIGGSPMGTAGGMKTTTIAILILVAFAYLGGKSDTEVFSRKIPEDNIKTALVVVMVGFGVLIAATLLVSATSHMPLTDAAFEATSALGTVGLSRSVTPRLSSFSKGIIIVTMFIGRIGPITLAMALMARLKKKSGQVHMPERRILIG